MQVALGDILGWRQLVWAMTAAMASGPQPEHELYERNHSGNQEQIRPDVASIAEAHGLMQEYTDLTDRCLDDHDLDGWTERAPYNDDLAWSFRWPVVARLPSSLPRSAA